MEDEQNLINLDNSKKYQQHSPNYSLAKKAVAEAIGTFGLTFLACGVGVAGLTDTIVCIAFGAVVVTMAYSIGNISGCHINPAVSLNFLIRKKMDVKEFLVYLVGQLIGGFLGSLFLGLCNHADWKNLCCNLIQPRLLREKENKVVGEFCGVAVETFLTFFFLTVINGVTDSRFKHEPFAGLIIGTALTLGVAAGFGYTGGSLNPFRSLGPALATLIGGEKEPIKEVWVFILGPCLGATLAAVNYMFLF